MRKVSHNIDTKLVLVIEIDHLFQYGGDKCEGFSGGKFK